MQRVPFGPSKEIMRSIFRTRAYADESIQRYWKQLQADPDNVKTTLLTKEYAEVENGTIPADQLIRDAHGNIVAGTDTTAVTATYAIWFLAQDTRIQQALIEEVSTLPDGFKDNDLRSLRVMGGVLNETLRLRSAIGGSLPRLVPPGGAQFCGYFIPEKTVVGIPTWTMHRDPAVMQDPERFDPSRWYEPTKDMLHNFLPFGGGSRVCIGSHLAQLELRHALANFYRTFPSGVRLSKAEGFSDADMMQMAYFLSPPKGKRCLVESRKQSFSAAPLSDLI
ncbi:hypothetical protein LTR91_022690 [Friedmanniomyces endolithicus]|uniref:Sterigmatocystin biosynthesis P450 monooxygenase STCB n=1 Tax=Friedmanniomyces endolithicus TaxID=329885 RepID=A0AAN6H7S9_9PEZI|nr:hypothetical protein LTR59_017856 [Friedmanniomyces endolithicus]KAK0950962.1 hypothetical protein LTS01_025425 [Friedmanniomyces endolithicus]KAK0955785.1 hypothetical protein LTR91_022690 [Friedmanniomyces endolithicus]